LWPTVAKYEDAVDYDLEDPKTTNQKDPSKWKEVNCPKEIEFLLRLRNQRHFGQDESDGTPFTKESMKHKFNWSALTNEAELVLKGEYNDEEISDITRLFLDNMTRITEAEDKPKFLTMRVHRKIQSKERSNIHIPKLTTLRTLQGTSSYYRSISTRRRKGNIQNVSGGYSKLLHRTDQLCN
jgi:hypothetical protein